MPKLSERPKPRYADWSAVPLTLSVRQVCAVTGLSRETVYGLIRRGILPSKSIGRRRVVTKAAVRELVEPVP